MRSRAGQVPARANEAPRAGRLASRLMLHLDGECIYLLIRDRSVTRGVPAGRTPPMCRADGQFGGPVTIERADEDYFLTSGGGVLINNQPAKRKLLADGDRIALSNRCRARFALPNPASTSALLSVSGARIPGTDATRVVLLADSLVIGPGPSAHVRADDLDAPVVVHVRDGGVLHRTAGSHGRRQHVTARPAAVDSQIRVGRCPW